MRRKTMQPPHRPRDPSMRPELVFSKHAPNTTHDVASGGPDLTDSLIATQVCVLDVVETVAEKFSAP